MQTQKPKNQKKPVPDRPILLRCVTLGAVFLLVAGGLGFQLSRLQIDQADELRVKANAQQLASVPIKPARGTIYDTNMKPLAQSFPVWTVEASPDVLAKSNVVKGSSTEKDPAKLASKKLAEILGLQEEELFAKLADKKAKYYKVKGQIEKPEADLVREMCKEFGIGGIYLRSDAKRYYPYEGLAASMLGFTNDDGDGIEGLESWYNEELAGTPGRSVAVRNALGQEMPTAAGEAMNYPAEQGYSLVTTIDTEIQQSLEKNLTQAVTEHKAKQRGMGIVMNVNTFEILAMATSPSYDPNHPKEIFDEQLRAIIDAMPDGEEKSKLQGEARILQWRNKALADTYEPGSVFKVVTAAAALDSGAFTPNSTFTCTSTYNVPGAPKPFGCAQGKAHGTITLTQALVQSCNTSFIKMAQGMGLETWYSYLKAFGMTEPTGVDLSGEPSEASIANLIYKMDKMGPVELASCSFGQSNKYTPVQMASAVAAAVNGGNLLQPHFVRQVLDTEGNVVKNIAPVSKRQVISPETSAILSGAMEAMVSGTEYGSSAYAAGYRVGGKSGTSQKLELLTQENREEYISSFVAFAPADKPEVVVLMALDEPEDNSGFGTYFGSRLVGPFASNVLRDALDVLGVEKEIGSEEEAARFTKPCVQVAGETLEDAKKVLEKEGLTPVVVGEGANVTGQSPAAYTQIPNGGQVVLYTAEGYEPELVEVPNFVGQKAAGAIALAKQKGFNVLTTGAPDSTSGAVIKTQDIPPGTKLEKGKTIALNLLDGTAVGDG